MNSNCILTSDQLLYCKPTLEDSYDIFSSYASDPKVTQYTTWKHHKSVQETEMFLNTCIRQWDKNEAFNVLLRHVQTNNVIGMIRYIRNGEAMQVGYVIARRYWNQGYATEAVRRVIEYVFTFRKINAVTSFCDIENRASARVLEKIGMRFVKILADHVIHPAMSDHLRDVRLYEITKQEWRSRLYVG